MRFATDCASECIFSKEGLLTADHKLNKAAIFLFFYPSDVAFRPVIQSAIEKCFTSYKSEVDSSLECKSGSHQFLQCLYRERFLNCPDSRWTASSECDELMANITECFKVPVWMNGRRVKRTVDTTTFSHLRLPSLDDFTKWLDQFFSQLPSLDDFIGWIHSFFNCPLWKTSPSWWQTSLRE